MYFNGEGFKLPVDYRKEYGYWTLCGVILSFDFAWLMIMSFMYGIHAYPVVYPGDEDSLNGTSYGGMYVPGENHPTGQIEWSHVGIMIYALILCIVLLTMGIINTKRSNHAFKPTGLLQTSLVILYVLIMIWTALGTSPREYRPHYNAAPILYIIGNLQRFPQGFITTSTWIQR